MFGIIFKGVMLGLGLSISVGPVFLGLINTSVTKGSREGVKMALGVSLSDWLFATVMLFGLGGALTQLGQASWLSLVGGGMLIGFGAMSITKSKGEGGPKPWTPPARDDYRRRLSSLGAGFALNTFNPGTPLLWVAISTAAAGLVETGSIRPLVMFMVAILVTVLASDMLKVYMARQVSHLLTPKRMRYVNAGVGVIMICVGLRFLYVGIGSF